jgi:UDP-N-acetylmuramate: L-alanyl-gamma-D-glutamyl-meso-diaminopimelate ligase
MKIHLTAVCGVGMAPLAVALKKMGHDVRGSDNQAYAPMSEVLADAGIPLLEGFDASNLSPRPDLVVVGNAVPRTNPEAVEVERLAIERISFPEAVARYLIRDSRSLVVAGTHGKTTTTGMLAFVLDALGFDPGYLVGGRVLDLDQFARAGSGDFFVVEGDEYDSAYFDKRPKFVHYRPRGVILTSIEFDHADIYRNVGEVESAFETLLSLTPGDAPVVACGEYESIRRVVSRAGRDIAAWYGGTPDMDWSYRNLQVAATETRFDVFYRDTHEQALRIPLPGAMNAANATAVFAMARSISIEPSRIAAALSLYRGAARRQQLIGEPGGVAVIDDFAHHPTAVRATLMAIAARYPSRRLVAAFEPRSNTSRRAVFQDDYADALSCASLVAISEVFAKANDPLAQSEMLSTERLIRDLDSRGTHAWTASGPDAILERLVTEIAPADVVVCMSNGAFGNLAKRLVSALRSRFAPAGTVDP